MWKKIAAWKKNKVRIIRRQKANDFGNSKKL